MMPRTAPSLPLFLALEDRQIPFICVWLDMQSLGRLDVSVSSSCTRKLWLMILESITCKAIDMWHHCYSSMMWAILRRIRLTHIQVNWKHRDRICELIFEAVGILSIWKERRYLESIDLNHCWGITDMGVSALVDGCGQLHTINISGIWSITDIGLSALGHGCGQLQSISLGDCHRITDMSVSALGHGCGQLQTINLRYCQAVTDMGVSALRERYPSIDIRG